MSPIIDVLNNTLNRIQNSTGYADEMAARHQPAWRGLTPPEREYYRSLAHLVLEFIEPARVANRKRKAS
jgi:hypothetical protein